VRTLRLVALSDDGTSLVLVADNPDSSEGERFELPVDDRLRAAARGDARQLGRIDVDRDASLPPRVIQARIRAGETPEQVAAASGTRVERIMRFAHPVLQERSRIAEQGREARVRLTDGTGVVTLQRFMAERLRLIGTDTALVEWDAHRGDDATWLVTAAWRSGEKSGTTRWAFDLPARTVAPADAATADFAEGTRLVRVVPDVPAGTHSPPAPRGRPVTVVRGAASEQETGPLPGPVPGSEADTDTAPAPGDDRDGSADEAGTDDEILDQIAEHDTVVLGRGEDGEPEDPRVHVPAWEDIVFGVRRHR
jgi:hypothetical protein